MTQELLVNNGYTTLNGSLTSVATSVAVADASTFPAITGTTGRFRIQVGKMNAELMLVTAVSGNIFTVTRGIEGTTARAHNDKEPVVQLATARGLADLTGGTRTVTGTTDTIVSTDARGTVVYNSASAVAVTLPQATTTDTDAFGPHFWVQIINIGAGLVTVTPTTSTINGASTQTFQTNAGGVIVSDGTNYEVMVGGVLPLTTKGDIYGYTTVNARMPVGADGRILHADSAQATGLGYSTRTFDANTHAIQNVVDPSNAQDAATKNYVDNAVQGITSKHVATCATTAALPAYTYLAGVITFTATGAETIDGHVTALNDYVLVKNETGANQPFNGSYLVTTAGAVGVAGVWTRSVDMDDGSEFPGASVFIEQGTANAGTTWICTNSTSPTVGTTAITFVQTAAGMAYTAGAGLTLTGTQFSITAPVSIALGGTNSKAALNNNSLMVSSGGAIQESAALTDGQMIVVDKSKVNTGIVSAPFTLNVCEGRLTLLSGTPIPTSDQKAATTVYFTPYKGDRIALYDGTRWRMYSFSEISVAVPANTNTPFDVFIYDNAGTVTLETVIWTNATTRATALTTQDGVLVKSGATTRRYLGTGCTTSVSGQCEDSANGGNQIGGRRFLWNYYNRALRHLWVTDITTSWTWNSAAWRISDGATEPTNSVQFVVGWSEDAAEAEAFSHAGNNGGNIAFSPGIGLDSGTANSAEFYGGATNGTNLSLTAGCKYRGIPGIGLHYLAWLEWGGGSNTTTFYGNPGTPRQMGLTAEVMA